MATQVQLRRGTAAQNDAFTGAQGELSYDTTNKRLRVHDGATAGGFEIKTEDLGGDISFADGEKAIFGAELEIYSDATHARIREYGGGQLKIQGDNLQLLTSDGASTYLEGNASTGAVTLYHASNAPRVATTSTGIDVTGTVTADGLNVEILDNNAGPVTIQQGGNSYFKIVTTNSSESVQLGNSTTNPDILLGGGNVGIGVSDPSTWSLGKALHIGNKENNLWGEADYAFHMNQNAYYNGGWKYSHSDEATQYTQADGQHIWSYAGSGTANAALSWSEAMRLDANGNVGIGTSSPTSSYGTNLNVHSSATNGAALHLTDGTTGNTSNDGFHLISTGGLAYVWNREATDMVFGTANLPRMTVDSSGNLLVGTSNENLYNTSTETGVVLRNNEKSAFSRDGGVPLYINRLTSPGGLLYFQNDGVNVGSIGIQSGGFTIDGEANHTGLMFAAASVLPRDNSANTNGTIDLGTNDGRWKDLYLSGNIDVTTTTSGLISAGAARQGSIIKLHHEAQWEAGYNSTPTDFLGAVEFSSGDASGSGLAGTGVRAAIRAYVKDAYNNVGLSFETGGSRAEAMRIDPSGNVGIAAVPEASYAPSLAIGYGGNNITSRGNADFRIMSGAFQDGASTFQYSVSSVPVAMLSMTNGGFAFAIAPAGTDGGAATFTNNMVLHASGALLVGNSGNWAAGADVCMIEANGLIDISRNDTSTQSAIAFYNPNGGIGSITVGGSATSYNTSSDYRLKTDAQPMTGASARVQALNPVNFEWIASGDRVDGFLAHEAQAVVPEAVTGTKDAMRDEEYEVTAAIEATYDDEGNELTAAVEAVMGTRSVPDMQGIDQSKLVPLLTAALQEALTEITALKARVTALEG